MGPKPIYLVLEEAAEHLQHFIKVLEGLQHGGLPLLSNQIEFVQDCLMDVRQARANIEV